MPPPNLGSIAGARPRFSLRGQSTVKWHWQPADEVHTNTPKDKVHQYEIEGTGNLAMQIERVVLNKSLFLSMERGRDGCLSDCSIAVQK